MYTKNLGIGNSKGMIYIKWKKKKPNLIAELYTNIKYEYTILYEKLLYNNCETNTHTLHTQGKEKH